MQTASSHALSAGNVTAWRPPCRDTSGDILETSHTSVISVPNASWAAVSWWTTCGLIAVRNHSSVKPVGNASARTTRFGNMSRYTRASRTTSVHTAQRGFMRATHLRHIFAPILERSHLAAWNVAGGLATTVTSRIIWESTQKKNHMPVISAQPRSPGEPTSSATWKSTKESSSTVAQCVSIVSSRKLHL